MVGFSFNKNRKWSIESYKKVLWQQILFSQGGCHVVVDIDINGLLYQITDMPEKRQEISIPLGLYLMNKGNETL